MKAKWKWSNVPIPVQYVALLVVGGMLHLFVDWDLFPALWWGHVMGWPVLTTGLVFAIWAMLMFGEMDFGKPTNLVSSGPYALGRNPMYVAWALIHLGIGLIVNSVWLLLFLPGAMLLTHFVDISREERRLELLFGQDYLKYKARVRRYF